MSGENMNSLRHTSPNRVYLVRTRPSPKFLAMLGTSDILKTLYEILNPAFGDGKIFKRKVLDCRVEKHG